jgi:glycerophosphoryl diester phosphodiesterase
MARTCTVAKVGAGVWLGMGLFFAVAAVAAPQKMGVEGHRGARARLPENSLPAMEYALKLGVDVLEMDLAVTKDRKLVLSHDPHINPVICLDAAGRKIEGEHGPLIFLLNLEEVKKFDCGSIQNPRFKDQKTVPGTRIPTLDEVFDLIAKSKLPAAKRVLFNIETKIFADQPGATTTPEEFAKLLVDQLKRRKMFDRTVIQSFDYRTLEAARALDSKVKIAALSENPKEDLVATALRLKADILSPNFQLVTPELVEKLHAQKIQVVPWTANDAAEWGRLASMGVDRIISDDPEALIAFLKSKKLR